MGSPCSAMPSTCWASASSARSNASSRVGAAVTAPGKSGTRCRSGYLRLCGPGRCSDCACHGLGFRRAVYSPGCGGGAGGRGFCGGGGGLGLLLIGGLPAISLWRRMLRAHQSAPHFTRSPPVMRVPSPCVHGFSTDTLRSGLLLRVTTDMEATLRAHGLRVVNGPLFLRHATPPQGHPCQVSRQDGLPDALLARVLLRGRAQPLGRLRPRTSGPLRPPQCTV